MARNSQARKQVTEAILSLPLVNAISYRQIQNHTSKIKCSEQSKVRALSELVISGKLTVVRGYFDASVQALTGGAPHRAVRFKIMREKLGSEAPKVSFPKAKIAQLTAAPVTPQAPPNFLRALKARYEKGEISKDIYMDLVEKQVTKDIAVG